MNETILIADDSALICDHFAEYLSSLGFTKIIKARDGNNALTACNENKVDLAFLDISMPPVNGLAVLKRLKEILPDIYVVMISASGTAENVKNSISFGASGFIVKPCSTKKIQEAVDKYRNSKA